jgi:antitoxin (DNA-binding transcriptional repressor) of toxin-antitoxin stability system
MAKAAHRIETFEAMPLRVVTRPSERSLNAAMKWVTRHAVPEIQVGVAGRLGVASRAVDEWRAGPKLCFSMKEVRIQVANVRKNFANVLARAAKNGDRIKVVRYRTTLAGIVPGRDLERLDECEDVMKGRSKKKVRASAGTARGASAQKASKKTAASRPRPTARPSKKRSAAKANRARK